MERDTAQEEMGVTVTLEKAARVSFRLLLDKLFVEIHLQFEPESFTTMPCARESCCPVVPRTLRFESPPEPGGRPQDGSPTSFANTTK
jgi:hypothetical protein